MSLGWPRGARGGAPWIIFFSVSAVSILRFLPDFGGRLLLPGPFSAIELDRKVNQNFVFI